MMAVFPDHLPARGATSRPPPEPAAGKRRRIKGQEGSPKDIPAPAKGWRPGSRSVASGPWRTGGRTPARARSDDRVGPLQDAGFTPAIGTPGPDRTGRCTQAGSRCLHAWTACKGALRATSTLTGAGYRLRRARAPTQVTDTAGSSVPTSETPSPLRKGADRTRGAPAEGGHAQEGRKGTRRRFRLSRVP